MWETDWQFCFHRLVSTHTAVSIDNDSVHKIHFQLHLKTALVPITSVARGLWYTEENTDFTTGTTEENVTKF